jgi:DNA-binding IclR family transcriptional regulator
MTKENVMNEVAVLSPKSISKSAQLLTLLQSGTGASLEDMTEAMGWQPHSVRAAMTGLRKQGYVITKHIEGNTSIWSAAVAIA